MSSIFGGTSIIYVTQGRELRPNYFSDESYWRKLSGADVIPVFDVIEEVNNVESAEEQEHVINRSGKSDYNELIRTIKEQF